DALRELALQQVRDAARELDDVEPTRDLGAGVVEHLAVLGRDRAGDVLGVRVEEVAEAEQDPGALAERGAAPCGERTARRVDRGIDVALARERDALADRSRGGIEDVADTAGLVVRGRPVDPVGDDGERRERRRAGHRTSLAARRPDDNPVTVPRPEQGRRAWRRSTSTARRSEE